MGMYTIIAGNEPNPDIIAEAYANFYMGRIMKSSNPQRMYQAVLKALDEAAEKEKLEAAEKEKRAAI